MGGGGQPLLVGLGHEASGCRTPGGPGAHPGSLVGRGWVQKIQDLVPDHQWEKPGPGASARTSTGRTRPWSLLGVPELVWDCWSIGQLLTVGSRLSWNWLAKAVAQLAAGLLVGGTGTAMAGCGTVLTLRLVTGKAGTEARSGLVDRAGAQGILGLVPAHRCVGPGLHSGGQGHVWGWLRIHEVLRLPVGSLVGLCPCQLSCLFLRHLSPGAYRPVGREGTLSWG